MLDEPTVGLDPVLRRDLWELFHRLADAGTTLLVSSHVMDEAERCHELLLLRDGVVLAGGTPDDLRARTGAKPWTRSFLRLIEGSAMSIRCTGATTLRVLLQLRRDPRTIVLIIGRPVPARNTAEGDLLGRPAVFQHVGAPLLGLFPFVSMFVVTSVTMLRERTAGTLERLMSMPLGKLDVLAGYAVAFGALAVVQATLVSTLAFSALDLQVAGPRWGVVALAVANATLGMSLGLFVAPPRSPPSTRWSSSCR